MVYMGTGAVWENPTCGIPVFNLTTCDGLLCAHKTLMWQLKGSTHKLTVILEEWCFALAQVSHIDEMLGEMLEGLGSEDKEDSNEDDSERDDDDIEQLAGGSL